MPGAQPGAARRPAVPGERLEPDRRQPGRRTRIAQFIPGTWATHGIDGNGDGKRDIWDPADAIPSAASYDCELAKYVKDVPGNVSDNMLAAYNAGAYRVIRAGGVPAISETQGYVKRIRSLEKSFAAPVKRIDPTRQAAGAIAFAQSKLGTPYLWGGDGTADQGGRFDCSGLTKAAYEKVGITLPRVANDQYNAGPHPRGTSCSPATSSSSPTTSPTRGPSGTWHLRRRRLHDRRAPVGRRHPVRPGRHTGLLRGHPGHRRWRKSAPHESVTKREPGP